MTVIDSLARMPCTPVGAFGTVNGLTEPDASEKGDVPIRLVAFTAKV